MKMEKKNTMYLMPLLRLTTIMVHVSGRITFGALSPARNLLTFAIIHVAVVCQSQRHISKVSKRSWRYTGTQRHLGLVKKVAII